MRAIRMRWWLAALAAVAWAGAAAGMVFGAEEIGARNLVENPDFRNDAAGWLLAAGFDVAKGGGRSGNATCLHLARKDGPVSDWATCPIPFQPGRRYRFSAWVRTRSVGGEHTGVTVGMEWFGPKGRIAGLYPPDKNGDNDWHRVAAITPPLPPEATKAQVTLGMEKGVRGEAWFDDVEIVEYWGPPLEAYFLEPAYRGILLEGDPRTVRVHVDLAEFLEGRQWQPDGGYAGLGELSLRGDLVAGGKPVVSRRLAPLVSRSFDLEFGAASLPVGPYRVDLVLRGGGRTLASQALSGNVRGPGYRPRVYIDRYRRTLVDGVPFFPIGFYTTDISEAEVATIGRAGFNCIMPYSISGHPLNQAVERVDMAQRHGVKVVYSIGGLFPGTPTFPEDAVESETGAVWPVRATIERLRDHPGLLAWYVGEELPIIMRSNLEARQRVCRLLDPDHLTWAVMDRLEDLPLYRLTADVLGTDPYPIPDEPVAGVEKWARETGEATRGTGAVWQVVQAFDWSIARKPAAGQKNRAPTYDEVRAMTYLALIGGAKGIFYYSYTSLQQDPLGFDVRWKDMARIAAELREMAPAILATQPAPADVKVVGARWMATCDGKTLWVLVANPEARVVGMRLTVPSGLKTVKTLDGRALAVRNGEIKEDLKPLACETYVAEMP